MDPKDRSLEELQAEIDNDPEIQRHRAEKGERWRRRMEQIQNAQQPVLKRLADVGISVEEVSDLFNKYERTPDAAVPVIFESLQTCEEDRILEMLVRALGGARVPIDGRPLIELYKKTWSEGLRFAILNTIAIVKPHSIAEWLAEARQNPHLYKTLKKLGYRWGSK
ncbi:MAG: hypothetical protein KF774_21600 [Planctomyces sp.]|nr:hypothetical protein [Planctomyces sp.]